MTRREAIAMPMAASAAQSGAVQRVVRYQAGGRESFGLLAGDTVTPVIGGLFQASYATAKATLKLSSVKLLYPLQPPKVLAVGRNYRSHAGENVPKRPEIFYKPATCLQHPGDPIVLPPDATNAHYEGELVLVIGKQTRNANREEAKAAIFGITCGNDVSERNWQGGTDKDMQWWRAKGADTFGPLGPAIVRGVDYSNLMLTTRLNGQVKQQQSTKDLIFDCPTIVSFVSRYVTLEQGDVIYTGTPGTTSKMSPGDVCEVEIENIGILRNPIKAG
jgi:2-keto-4-pentenoate hydratase/2-oxohepta-3-ene-1,7-dioic acid hydratase in catechol pathway